jgi:osmotically inducible lipoprotein OsmB
MQTSRFALLSLCGVVGAGLVAACGHTTEQKAATGAVAGAVVAGPVGAAVGGAAGAVVGQADRRE